MAEIPYVGSGLASAYEVDGVRVVIAADTYEDLEQVLKRFGLDFEQCRFKPVEFTAIADRVIPAFVPRRPVTQAMGWPRPKT